MTKTLVVAGNIGAGKSTTLDALQQLLSEWPVCYVPEPVHEWREKGYLEEFYKTGNAFEFQLQVLYSRISAYEKALNTYLQANNNTLPNIIIFDRWFEEDREFALINYRRGSMTQNQYGIYTTAYNYLCKHYPMPDISIWLDVKPELCLQRLQTRGRPEEISGITLEYLQEINKSRENYKHIINVTETVTPLEIALQILNKVL